MKNITLISKIGGQIETLNPRTTIDNVSGAVKTVNGLSPNNGGNVIVGDYITKLTINGHTITYTKKDGTRGIFRG